MSDWYRSADAPPDPPNRPVVFLHVGVGIATVFAMHLAVGGAFALALAAIDAFGLRGAADLVPVTGMIWLVGIGITQVTYVGPAVVAAWFVRRPIALGMVIAAALTFVLNGVCFGFASTLMS